jgi:hypothetical protein
MPRTNQTNNNYVCRPGCLAGFNKLQALHAHRTQSPACKALFRESIKKQIEADIAQQQLLKAPVEEPHAQLPDQPLMIDEDGPDNYMDWQPDMIQDGVPNDEQPVERSLSPLDRRSPSPLPPPDLETPDEDEEIRVAEVFDTQQESREIIEEFPTAAGTIVAHEPSYFTSVLQKHLNDHGENIYYPFANSIDWELAAWMHESGLTVTEMDRFLSTQYVSLESRFDLIRLFLTSVDSTKASILQEYSSAAYTN